MGGEILSALHRAGRTGLGVRTVRILQEGFEELCLKVEKFSSQRIRLLLKNSVSHKNRNNVSAENQEEVGAAAAFVEGRF